MNVHRIGKFLCRPHTRTILRSIASRGQNQSSCCFWNMLLTRQPFITHQHFQWTLSTWWRFKFRPRLLFRAFVTQKETYRKPTALQRRYNDHHDCCVCVWGSLKAAQSVCVNYPSLDVKGTDRLATEAYPKPLSWKLGLCSMLSATTETMKIDVNGTPSTISYHHASFAPLSETDAFETSLNVPQEPEYPEVLPRKHCATGLSRNSAEAQWWTTSCTVWTTEIKPKQIGKQTKCSWMKYIIDCEYIIDYIVRHESEHPNRQYIMK